MEEIYSRLVPYIPQVVQQLCRAADVPRYDPIGCWQTPLPSLTTMQTAFSPFAVESSLSFLASAQPTAHPNPTQLATVQGVCQRSQTFSAEPCAINVA